MTIARQILDAKPDTTVWSVGPDATLRDAVRLLIEKGIGAVLVMEGDAVRGILSERDCAWKLIQTGKESTDVRVREFMTPRVIYARPDMTVEECLALMSDKRVRHLPVMEGGRVLGMVSQGDLVKSMLSHQQFIIHQLENYITGARS
jgi:CBS domain-containing protein